MVQPMNDIANLSSLDLATLLTYRKDASESAAVALPGTATHTLRVAHLGRICAELRRRGH